MYTVNVVVVQRIKWMVLNFIITNNWFGSLVNSDILKAQWIYTETKDLWVCYVRFGSLIYNSRLAQETFKETSQLNRLNKLNNTKLCCKAMKNLHFPVLQKSKYSNKKETVNLVKIASFSSRDSANSIIQ